MSEFFLFLGALLIVAVLVWLLFRGADSIPLDDAPTLIVPPIIAEPEKPKPQPVPMVQIRLLSERGTVIGATKIAAKTRKQQMTFTTGKSTTGVFQARQFDGGVWIYQRVSIEK